MKKIFDILSHNPLFDGVGLSEFESMLKCVEARQEKYNKNDIIILAGDSITQVGLVLSGSVKVMREDINGNSTIIAEFSASEAFGEVFACAEVEHSPVTVIAGEKSEIMFINYKKVVKTCSSACVFHTKLIENMLKLISRKNILLNQKIEILSRRTTREKLLLFFDIQRGGLKKFTINYNREELANYLCVDRSAMSNELCKMRDQGIIKFNKNEFEILK